MRIIIFGTGSGSLKLLQRMEEENLFEEDEIIAFSDNNSAKWGTSFSDYKICSPDSLCNIKFDYIVVASVYFPDIDKQLQELYGIPFHQILTVRDYFGMKYVKQQYLNYYGDTPVKDKKYPLEKIVIYTANLGHYDELEEPSFLDDNVEYICFTDDRDYHSNVWQTEYINTTSIEDYPLHVRKLKLFPDKLFSEYDISVWVDSKFKICGDLRQYINKYLRNSSLLHFPHFERNCIYEEALECIRVKKGNPIMIGGQIYQYYNERYPRNNGLLEGGCIVRAHHDEQLKKVMFDWWEQIKHYSRRDQISLPYVCWKNHFRYDICDLYINRCKYLDVRMHKDKQFQGV